MGGLKLREKIVIVPEKPTERRRIFLSNIDLSLVAYQESVCFFGPPVMCFSDACAKLYRALERLFVHYDFFAGRLAPSPEDDGRLEIDCNGAGVVVAAATTETRLSDIGELARPKPEYKQFVAFLHEDKEEEMGITDMPLLFIQLTQLGCGGIALASRYNHCVLDGVAVREFQANMAALTLAEQMVIMPNPDRTVFRARNPPVINYPHHEYSKPIDIDMYPTRRKANSINPSSSPARAHLIYLSPVRIAAMKKAVTLRERETPTTFQVVAAMTWKARSIAMEMEDDRISTILFPVDARRRVVPNAPAGFAGNALIPGFARATVRELKKGEECDLVRRVKEGVERLDDEYVKSSIDWLEVNKGMPCRDDSFSLVAWSRLGLEEDEFVWGKIKCTTPAVVKPGLVYLLPGHEEEGGLNICLELPDNQMEKFHSLMMEN
ncbi:Omega-hydroxypalmitate O-feruloyl transferase [Bertholletia excelsa]